MRHFFILLRHELRRILLSPTTYLAAFFFLLVMGLIYQLILEGYNQAPQEMLPSNMFISMFFIPVVFLVPLLTMRSLAEERRQGLMDSLLTTPINSIELVAGKFAAAYLFYIVLYLLTLAYPAITYYYFPDERILDKASLAGGYAFICVSGFLFVSIGILASSLTRSQLVAGIFSFALLFILIVGTLALNNQAELHLNEYETLHVFLEYIHVIEHVNDFSRGIIDTRPIVFYLSATFLTLSMAVLAVDHKSAS